MKYNDIYTETPAHADTLANLGPLAPLAGKWYGEDGVDTHPEAEGPVAEPYHETWTFEVIDAQNNGPQVFYGLRYHVYITNRANSTPSTIRWAISYGSPKRRRST